MINHINRLLLNELVNTPIGQGRFQGEFVHSLTDRGQAAIVRLPINDDTRKHLTKSNCLTPGATQSGLWVFGREELA